MAKLYGFLVDYGTLKKRVEEKYVEQTPNSVGEGQAADQYLNI